MANTSKFLSLCGAGLASNPYSLTLGGYMELIAATYQGQVMVNYLIDNKLGAGISKSLTFGELVQDSNYGPSIDKAMQILVAVLDRKAVLDVVNQWGSPDKKKNDGPKKDESETPVTPAPGPQNLA